jgi:hypothetical protein
MYRRMHCDGACDDPFWFFFPCLFVEFVSTISIVWNEHLELSAASRRTNVSDGIRCHCAFFRLREASPKEKTRSETPTFGLLLSFIKKRSE